MLFHFAMCHSGRFALCAGKRKLGHLFRRIKTVIYENDMESEKMLRYSEKVRDYLRSRNVELGDLLRIKFRGLFLEGFLLPQNELGNPDVLVIKLRNGYNIGIHIDNVESLDVVSKGVSRIESFPKRVPKGKGKKIFLLHAGGTIASRVDYRTGGVVPALTPEEIVALIPEIEEFADIEFRIISSVWSEDMRGEHFVAIARGIVEAIKNGADGIIVTHGTDTMHYSASAASFMVQNLPIPVVFTGAQRSSDRGSSDAGLNLIASFRVVTSLNFGGVGICMHASSGDEYNVLLPAVKARKMHTSRRDAFKPVNGLPWAIINNYTGEIKVVSSLPPIGNGPQLKDGWERKVALIKSTPDMDPSLFEFYIDKDYKGLIIEGTGLGHLPAQVFDDASKPNELIYRYIRNFISRGGIVGMTSQCLYGRVNMNVYSKGRDLQRIGVIPCEDMLPEVAYVKLKWLLGNYSQEDARKLLNKNIVGEINSRSSYSENMFGGGAF